ncbi:MAG: biopolymer transporter ExbD [Acidobacteriota bacterium]|nr:biopolymer transporter ExbD [Acidobacteriota bacterium]
MKLKKAPPPVSEINVTPMVDVMLVVLIIFMVITPLLSKSIPVDKAVTRNPVVMADADKEDAVIVAITRDGQTFLSPGLQKIEISNLAPAVRDLLQNRASKLVYINADARAKYSVVEDVVDNLRAGSVDEVGLLTEQSQDQARLDRVLKKGGGGL